MLSRISRTGDLPSIKPYRLRLSFDDKSRSDTDLLHRFIAHLNLPNFKIEKVDISEYPAAAVVYFREAQEHKIAGSRFRYFYKRKWTKSGRRFKLQFSVFQLDHLGTNFQIDYDFDHRPREELSPQVMSLAQGFHSMMLTAFKGHSNFLLSRVLNTDLKYH